MEEWKKVTKKKHPFIYAGFLLRLSCTKIDYIVFNGAVRFTLVFELLIVYNKKLVLFIQVIITFKTVAAQAAVGKLMSNLDSTAQFYVRVVLNNLAPRSLLACFICLLEFQSFLCVKMLFIDDERVEMVTIQYKMFFIDCLRSDIEREVHRKNIIRALEIFGATGTIYNEKSVW